MKIIVFVGSCRNNGNTVRVVRLIEEQLEKLADRTDQPLEIETVHLGQRKIQFCRGCRICFDRGEERCPLKDDLLATKAKMKEADAMILACPVYVNDVSGIVKNWMDRLAHVSHRPEFAGKCAYLVATVGNGPAGHALRTMRMALSQWGFHIVGQQGFKTGALMKEENLRGQFQEKTGWIAHHLFHAIRKRQFARPSFVSLMTFKIQQRYWQRVTGESVDYHFWQKNGWIESDRDFYFQHDSNRIKVISARLAGAALARFVT